MGTIHSIFVVSRAVRWLTTSRRLLTNWQGVTGSCVPKFSECCVFVEIHTSILRSISDGFLLLVSVGEETAVNSLDFTSPHNQYLPAAVKSSRRKSTCEQIAELFSR